MIDQAKFVKKVISEITFGGRLPNKINNTRLSTIISNALDDFRDRDDRSTSRHHLVLKHGVFNTELFNRHRNVLLPDCVKAVTNLRLSHRQFRYFGSSVDMDFNRYGSFSSLFTDQGSSLLQAIGTASYYDYADGLTLDSVSYDFNEYSHELTIIGQTPKMDLIAEVYSYVCDEALYSMTSFFKYVCGKCYEDYIAITSFTKQKLLNEYDLDISKIEKKGDKLIKIVEEEWEDQKGESDFIMQWI